MRYLQNDKLDKYLINNAASSVISKASQLKRWGKYTTVLMDTNDGGVAKYRVQSEEYSNIRYDITISNFIGPGPLVTSCSCPYNWGGICKHVAAMLIHLDQHEALAAPVIKYEMADCKINLIDLSDQSLHMNTSDVAWKNRGNIKKVQVLRALDGVATCKVSYHKVDFTVHFERLSANTLKSACSCGETLSDPLCSHKLAALLELRDQFGLQAFEYMQDWTAEKNKLLAAYGYSTADELEGKFEFKVDNGGNLQMTVLDKSIPHLNQLGAWWKTNEKRFEAKNRSYTIPKFSEPTIADRILLYAFMLPKGEDTIPDMTLIPLVARYDLNKNRLSHVGKMDVLFGSVHSALDIPPISEQDSKLIGIARTAFSANAILTAIRDAGFSMPRWHYQTLPADELNEDMHTAAQEYLGRIWDTVLALLDDRMTMFSHDPHIHLQGLSNIIVDKTPVKPSFRLFEEDEFVVLQAFLSIDGEEVPLRACKPAGFWFLENSHRLIKIAQINDAFTIRQMLPAGQIKVKKQYRDGFLSDLVLPLTRHYDVDFDLDLPTRHLALQFLEKRIYIKEDEGHLIFVPAFAYRFPDSEEEAFEFSIDGKREQITYEEPFISIWRRDVEQEQAFETFLQNEHPAFAAQSGKSYYYLTFSEVLAGQWLFHFFEKAQAQNIAVFGFNQLKKFKYNPNRPSFKIKASSGIDWFDMKMEVAFGAQFVSLGDIKKAVLNKQNYVHLGDGSIGMLPEEWLERYASLFKFGQVKDDVLKVSKMHFSIVDALYSEIDDVQVLKELQEKKRKLLNFKEIQDVHPPENLKASLRDYQKEGFKWLNFLDEFKWGGCLADDMGLGKTVQVLSFLQHRKNIEPSATNLIVVPTTLLFNWQAEVEKFTPGLTVFVHRGVGRQKELDFLKTYDLVLTTYGTLRSDIEFFAQIEFDYVVLDESQAVKNPDSKIAKAVKLLVARNRLVMTGTPVENNTFDLYSQMEFLNPGLLGSQEFFRSEFATPIDKYRDEDKARELRKLIYPFVLKRTKEEVAKDLPDKTETILFCEMGKKQRKVYETFRDMYRQKIVDKMEEGGKDKAAFLILEGLLKLRQICDSPALLSNDADYGEDSAKLEEIIREISENAGNHKILIFSQFLKMLDLVRQHLVQSAIPYEYLDGSTVDRAERVRNFQESEHCRVFLMSLKAGGVGINLTEADYVYLIDPWWNPAVEQQAIDRTHRIGQTKKVFAYKMICKDTVEEKILLLQEKKRDIAKDLISTEQGLIKKLTKEDIVGLFS